MDVDLPGSNNSQQSMSIHTLEFDGASRGNPGLAGAGAVLIEADSLTRRIVWQSSSFVGENCTNNEAEYRGLILGLGECLKRRFQNISVMGDSELVIKQIVGEYKVRSQRLKPLHAEAVHLLSQFTNPPSFRWIPREENSLADQIANEAIDAYLAAGRCQEPSSTPTSTLRFNLAIEGEPDKFVPVLLQGTKVSLITGKLRGDIKGTIVSFNLGKGPFADPEIKYHPRLGKGMDFDDPDMFCTYSIQVQGSSKVCKVEAAEVYERWNIESNLVTTPTPMLQSDRVQLDVSTLRFPTQPRYLVMA